MSSFASGAGSTLTNLSKLAQRTGEGQGFNTRFAQERQLTAEGQRQRQIDDQAVRATEDRAVRLQQLAAQNEATRFQQALAAQKQQADEVRKNEEQSTADRQRDLANQFKQRDLDRLQGQLELSREGEARLQRQQELQASPPPGSKEFNKQQRLAVDELADISRTLDPISGPDLDDETRLALEQRKDQLTSSLVELQQAGAEIAKNTITAAQVLQQQRAVTQKEAGPVLERTLEAAGQSRVLELPINPETGRTDTQKLKIGKIYQTSRGPAVRLGNNSWDLIDELGDINTTIAANQPTRPEARTQPAGSQTFRPSFGGP